MTLVHLTFAWLAGIGLASLLWAASVTGCATPRWPFAAVTALSLAALFVFRRRQPWRLVALLALMATLGAWRYQAHPALACLDPSDLAFMHAGSPVQATVEGVVIGYPRQNDRTANYRLRADRLVTPDGAQPVRGDVLVQASRVPLYRYGDRLRVTGVLKNPPVFADFDYHAYLARRGIRGAMWRAEIEKVGDGEGSPVLSALYAARARGSALLDRLLPEPSAALANGMLLGIESGIPQEVGDAYRAVGASHVIVISGSNVALLAGVLLAMLGRVMGRRRAALPVIAAIGLYVLLIGAEPAALRAGIMGILWVLAIALGRQNTAWVALAASALAMTLINPLAAWDVGFQISFAATLGLILFSGPLAAWATRRWKASGVCALSDGLTTTFAAQILVIPLVLFHFGQFSPISPLVNALIAPAQPPILAGGMATLLFGLVWEPLGRILAVVPWLFLTYTTGVVELAARAPFATLDFSAQKQGAMLPMAAVATAGFGVYWLWRTGRLGPPERGMVALAAAGALPLWVALTAVSAAPDGRLHITYLPRRGAEAALVTTPQGARVLITDAAEGKEVQLPAGIGALDLWISPGQQGEATAGPERLDPRALPHGARLRIADGVTLERLGDGEEWALALRYGRFVALLPSLPDAASQARLAENGDLRGITLVKLPGPETGRWPAPEMLAAATAQVQLWPEETTYPPGVVHALEARALRVAPETVVEVTTDGERIWLRQSSGQFTRALLE